MTKPDSRSWNTGYRIDGLIQAANSAMLARLRWLAERNQDEDLERVFYCYDMVLATELGIDPAAVPRATRTEPVKPEGVD